MHKAREIIGRNLKACRLACSLSQEELASRAGLHRTYVSSVERGLRNVTIDNVFALADALGVSPAELIDPDRFDGES